jgi:lysylphosphatidylglycerol synthetase-like protein (DUF2156 family)
MKIFSDNLNTLNYYAILLHGLSFVGVLSAFLAKNEEANFNTELYELKIEALSNGDRDAELGTRKVTKIPTNMLKAFILFVFAFTAFVHYFYYSDGFGTGSYTSELNAGRNRFRWAEYAITATMMVFVASIISGVKSSDSVFLICMSILVLMSFGYFIEMTPSVQAKVVGLVAGFILLGSAWYVVLNNFYHRISEVEDLPNPSKPGENRKIPSWVKQVLVPLMFWYILFGVVSTLYVRGYNKPNFNFRTYERYYIILSYMSKAFLGYYLAFGLTRPAREDS